MSLAESTPTIDPHIGWLFVVGTKTSSLPIEQSSRSETEPILFRLLELPLLSWLKYVDTVSTLGRREVKLHESSV